MTTITRLPARKRGRLRGLTLVEVMIAAALSGAILTAVLTTFLFLGRSGENIVNYAEMESQARRGLELFAEDTRQASDIAWNSATEVRLTVNFAYVVYGYDAGNRVFYRTADGTRRTIISGVDAFSFQGYKITGGVVDLSDLAQAAQVTKQLQISLRASRTTATVATATNTVLSARFILRNKHVTT